MLIDFVVANFRSIKEEAILSMAAARIRSRNPSTDQNNLILRSKKPDLLKSAAIYGANASGKSNLVKALAYMRQFTLNSSKDSRSGESTGSQPFLLSSETEHQPSFFEIVIQINDAVYRYGFEVNSKIVVSEWLFRNTSTREAKLFTRQDGAITLGPSFKEGRGLEDKTRDNALFLSVVAQFNGALSGEVTDWFEKLAVLSGIHDQTRTFSLSCLDKHYRDEILRLIKDLDFGVENLHTKDRNPLLSDQQNDPTLFSSHTQYDRQGQKTGEKIFDFDEAESDGTGKLFALAGPLIDTLYNGEVLVIDELDARFHPLITTRIIQLFNSVETNKNNAQLIFTTHDVYLLNKDLFRRDQIWFTEKDRLGATALFSLAEYKIRNDASFGANYLKGKYGAIPYIGNPFRQSDAS